MPIPLQDFAVSNTADFTGKALVGGEDHNNLVNEATPYSDATYSKGLVVTTTDTALNTPDVPDANATIKYQGYLWHRICLDDTVKVYSWNPAIAPDDPTYLKWDEVKTDVTTIEADITTLENDVTALQNDVQTAVTTAENALNIANDALTLADNANTNATNALTAATTAQTTADEALTIATAANNAVTSIKKFTSSSYNPLGSGIGLTFVQEPHLLGGLPTLFRGVMSCVTADANFAAGEEYPIEMFLSVVEADQGDTDTNAAIIGPAFFVSASATNILVKSNHNGTIYFRGAAVPIDGDHLIQYYTPITIANFLLKIYAFRYV